MEDKGQLICELWLAEHLISFRNEVKNVVSLFKTPYEVYECCTKELEGLGLNERLVSALADKSLANANRLLNFCEQHSIRRIRYDSPDYPSLLREIPDPPYLLFCKGNTELLTSTTSVGMVGTRSMTTAGKYSAFRMSCELASAGMCIVSGMALGNDSVCHAGAMVSGGKTIAVLGCGIDIVYPAKHTYLYEQIIESGNLVISEFLPGTPPLGINFPRRNRIIAGMCIGTVVVEATENSGSLITANYASDYGRLVFAMPGYAYSPATAGNNKLVGQGAILTVDAQSVVKEINLLTGSSLRIPKRSRVALEDCERAISNYKLDGKVYDGTHGQVGVNKQTVPSDGGGFPFSVRYSEKRERFGVNADAEGTEKQGSAAARSGDVARADEHAPRQAASASVKKQENETDNVPVREPDPDACLALCDACEELGVKVDADMTAVCSVIAREKTVSVDLLCREGCRTEAALCVLSLLSSVGLLTEEAGGNFKLCNISDEAP